MSFYKSFPKRTEKTIYPRWEEISLSAEEEKLIEQKAALENVELMKQSIDEAMKIFEEKNLKKYQTDMIRLAIALFEKKASHNVYHKERKAKDKFNSAG